MNQTTDTALLGAPQIQRPGSSAARARRSAKALRALSVLAALVLLAGTLEIVIDGSLGRSPLIPKSPHIATWLSGIGERLGFRVFLIALLALSVAYAVLAWQLARVPARWVIALVAALNVIVFAGPILISTDVFSYIAYARMGVLHGVNPYLHGPFAIHSDPIYKYVGFDWTHVATAYGPLYTLLSYPLAWLGISGALWAMKLWALAASAVTLTLTWRCAVRRGLEGKLALFLVGANPLYVIYALGGAHNDLIMLAFMMAAVSLTLSEREASAAGAVIAGAFIKATVAALLPFMVLGRRRLAPIIGTAVAIAACALAGYLAFGIHGVDLIAALNRDAAFVSTDSFATEIAHLFGKPGIFPIDHDLLKAALVIIVVHLLWRTWRGYDWVAASGWTLLAIALTSTWLLAWYVLWPLPLAVISKDRRLLWATLAAQALFVIHQTSPLLAPVS
jgi:alpha-1,6-mannosyltransferase